MMMMMIIMMGDDGDDYDDDDDDDDETSHTRLFSHFKSKAPRLSSQGHALGPSSMTLCL